MTEHFTRVLVDFDMLHELINHILVKREWYAFCIYIDYEIFSLFWESNNIVGHSMDNCQKNSNGHRMSQSIEDVAVANKLVNKCVLKTLVLLTRSKLNVQTKIFRVIIFIVLLTLILLIIFLVLKPLVLTYLI